MQTQDPKEYAAKALEVMGGDKLRTANAVKGQDLDADFKTAVIKELGDPVDITSDLGGVFS